MPAGPCRTPTSASTRRLRRRCNNRAGLGRSFALATRPPRPPRAARRARSSRLRRRPRARTTCTTEERGWKAEGEAARAAAAARARGRRVARVHGGGGEAARTVPSFLPRPLLQPGARAGRLTETGGEAAVAAARLNTRARGAAPPTPHPPHHTTPTPSPVPPVGRPVGHRFQMFPQVGRPGQLGRRPAVVLPLGHRARHPGGDGAEGG